jgi:hypothetical protein
LPRCKKPENGVKPTRPKPLKQPLLLAALRRDSLALMCRKLTAGEGFMLEVVRGLLVECLESLELDRPDWAGAVYDLPQLIEGLQAS